MVAVSGIQERNSHYVPDDWPAHKRWEDVCWEICAGEAAFDEAGAIVADDHPAASAICHSVTVFSLQTLDKPLLIVALYYQSLQDLNGPFLPDMEQPKWPQSLFKRSRMCPQANQAGKDDNKSRVITGAPQWMGGGAATEAQQEVKS